MDKLIQQTQRPLEQRDDASLIDDRAEDRTAIGFGITVVLIIIAACVII